MVRTAKRGDGLRSGLERVIADWLYDHGINYEYEPGAIKYTVPERTAKYTPDFVLSNGIIIETKGRFVTADRQKMRRIREQCPNLDIRFIFSRPNDRISKQSTTTYGMWCDKQGFPYAGVKDAHVWGPWLTEPANVKAMEAAIELIK